MVNILVVDDDKNMRFLMQEILELEQYNVFTAKNGEEALELLDREHIDLAIVDIMMPKIDGYEFTSLLRDGNLEMPVLMVSAKQLPIDRKKGFESGINAYMSKPIDPEELILQVKGLLRCANITSSEKIVVGDVVLDYGSFTVSKGEEKQELPQKEFLLLWKLLSYPDKIFTKMQLMDEIWGYDSESDWETVRVHVGRLRKRFEGWEEFEIKNVRGFGYKAVKKV